MSDTNPKPGRYRMTVEIDVHEHGYLLPHDTLRMMHPDWWIERGATFRPSPDCGHAEHVSQRQIDACLAGPKINDDPLVALLARCNDLTAKLRARIDAALAEIDDHRWASRDDHLAFIRAALVPPSGGGFPMSIDREVAQPSPDSGEPTGEAAAAPVRPLGYILVCDRERIIDPHIPEHLDLADAEQRAAKVRMAFPEKIVEVGAVSLVDAQAPAASEQPQPGDRVRLTYGDGSGREGTWELIDGVPALRLDDGTVHSHVAGQVRRDVLNRRPAASGDVQIETREWVVSGETILDDPREHEAILAAKDAEIQRLREDCDRVVAALARLFPGEPGNSRAEWLAEQAASEIKQRRADLLENGRDWCRLMHALRMMEGGPDEAIAEADRLRLRVAQSRQRKARIDKALALHREFRIYGECGHHHEDDDEDVIEVDEIGLTCQDGYMYSICENCCTGGSRQWQTEATEACASEHKHEGSAACWPCPTRAALSGGVSGTPEAHDG